MILGERCGVMGAPYEEERALFEELGWPG